MVVVCRECGRELKTGDEVFASEWKVITDAGIRLETRYACAPECPVETEVPA